MINEEEDQPVEIEDMPQHTQFQDEEQEEKPVEEE